MNFVDQEGLPGVLSMMVDKFSRELFLSSNSFQVYCKKKIMNVVRGQVGIDDEVKNWNYYCDEIRPVMFR